MPWGSMIETSSIVSMAVTDRMKGKVYRMCDEGSQL